jgi:hypothetical protein
MFNAASVSSPDGGRGRLGGIISMRRARHRYVYAPVTQGGPLDFHEPYLSLTTTT